MSFEQAVNAERQFFEQPDFRELPDGSYGRDALASRLTMLLADRVRAKLPEIKNQVRDKLAEVERELRQPSMARVPTDPASKRMDFIDTIRSMVGKVKTDGQGEGATCADIFDAFDDASSTIHKESLDYKQGLENKEEFMVCIKESMRENAGLGSGVGGYLSYKTAERFIRTYVESIEGCIDEYGYGGHLHRRCC